MTTAWLALGGNVGDVLDLFVTQVRGSDILLSLAGSHFLVSIGDNAKRACCTCAT